MKSKQCVQSQEKGPINNASRPDSPQLDSNWGPCSYVIRYQDTSQHPKATATMNTEAYGPGGFAISQLACMTCFPKVEEKAVLERGNTRLSFKYGDVVHIYKESLLEGIHSAALGCKE